MLTCGALRWCVSEPNATQLARFIFDECKPKGAPPPTPTGAGSFPSFGPAMSLNFGDDFSTFVLGLPRTLDGSVDLAALNQPPQGDRSAEGLQWNPTLGYHRDLGEAFWEGQPLSYLKLKQLQAVCNAYDVSIDVDKMQHWTVTQATDYFMAHSAH